MKKHLPLLVISAFTVAGGSSHALERPLSEQYDQCMQAAASSNTKIAACSKEEGIYQDARLKASIQKIEKILSPSLLPSFQQSQLAWERYREAECAFQQAAISEQKTPQREQGPGCRTFLTGVRSTYLGMHFALD